MTNRDLYPRLAYEDVEAAVEWSTRVFGLKEPTRNDKTLRSFSNYHELWGEDALR